MHPHRITSKVVLICAQCGVTYERYPSRLGKYCSARCGHAARALSLRRQPKDFWARVKVGAADACWPWLGGSGNNGYGVLRYAGRLWLAHRLAYTLTHGTPPRFHVCHTCDNPACCNPAHLFDGTDRDNVHDALAKGRMARGERSGPARLTEEQVREIRRTYVPGEMSYAALARRYGVAMVTIHHIVVGNTWRHVK